MKVYATARGPLARIADPVAARTRARRHEALFALTGATATTRILDVGCGTLGLRGLAPELDVTGTDLVERPSYPGPFVLADATERLPFEDGAFDLAYSSSVVEHVAPEQRAAFAAEVRRVARGWYVQTPARSFPIEPHALLPLRALAAPGAAPPVLASRGRGRLGGHLPPRPRRAATAVPRRDPRRAPRRDRQVVDRGAGRRRARQAASNRVRPVVTNSSGSSFQSESGNAWSETTSSSYHPS